MAEISNNLQTFDMLLKQTKYIYYKFQNSLTIFELIIEL